MQLIRGAAHAPSYYAATANDATAADLNGAAPSDDTNATTNSQ